MNVELLRALISAKGTEPYMEERSAIDPLIAINGGVEVSEYLTHCLTSDGFEASGVRVKGLSGLVDENLCDAAPGCLLRNYGFVVIATSIGGNAVVVDSNGAVHWADHSCFQSDRVSYKLPTGEWRDERPSADSVSRALHALSSQLEPFLVKLFKDELLDQLDLLD